jgi:cytochrome c-type biogenesis protein CcmF
MEKITYVGEHLFIGNLGHFFVVLAFITAILSSVFYLRSSDERKSEKTLARIFFFIHALAVIGIFVTLFVIIQKHYFEYAYAYQHSSLTLPLRYMISCFWEGQEGSFLLWIVWNALLGVILIFTAKKWEKGVVAILALSQMVLSAMLLGIDFGSAYTLGSSPFELLRDKMDAPIFGSADYLKNIVDGTGLNPLLQNYWMVIHPPTLFLGFALTIIPFAYAVTSLFQNDHRGWIKPALPWALAGGMILGLGIVMGGFWAYESLSFGGYWAWDPVENASLVPWLLLIAGIHLMLIKKATNSSTIAAYTLSISSYIFVLYATFLTRSGVLGETSVHSFTDLGLAGQLMQFVVVFIWLPIIAVTPAKQRIFFIVPVTLLVLFLPFYEVQSFYPLLVLSIIGIAWFVLNLNKQLTNSASEDNIWGREFWMFIGSLILVLSAVQVTLTTSLPVFNKVFGTSFAPPSDVIQHYNQWQLPIGIVIAFLTAIGQYFRYKSTPDKHKLLKELLIILVIAVLLTVGGIFLFKISNALLVILMLAAIYAIVANLSYLILYVKKHIKLSGSSIAHIGFGFMLLGVLVSSAKKQVITADFDGKMGNFNPEARKENMLLLKGEPTRLGEFMVTYQGDSISGEDIYFKVNYKSIDGLEEFTLMPNTQIGEDENLMPNPDTRHYLTYDVYTHITSLPRPIETDSVDWQNVKEYEIQKGDSIVTNNGVVYFTGVEQASGESIGLKNTTLAKAMLEVRRGNNILTAEPIFGINENTFFSIRRELAEAGLRFGFEVRTTDGEDPKAILEIAETTPQPQFIVMKGIVFPYINLLWMGTILMIIGFGIAMFNRLELKRGA